jgi:AcrR family transcriptional regulator
VSSAEPLTTRRYFDAGMVLLADGGIGAVTIENLCRQLQVTKGSFYHHFRSGEDYRQRLLHHWATDPERAIHNTVEQLTDPLARLAALKRYALDLNHAAESAIRAWARSDEAVAVTQARVDSARERALAQVSEQAGLSAEAAQLYARASLTILIGAQQRDRRVNRKRLLAMFDLLTVAAFPGVTIP